MQLSWVFLLPLAIASICPMEKHQVCNPENDDYKCTCTVIQADEASAPEQSCNNMIERDEEENNSFPAVSVKFNLDDSTSGMDDWPQESFKEAIASSLRIDEDDILILRASCMGTEDELTVQFAVLKKDQNETSIPHSSDDFVDAESIATRMKAMGHLSQIADLDVDSIEFVEELIDIEFAPSNDELIFQGILVAIFCAVCLILGIYCACRKTDYSDDLQKA